MLQSIAKSRAKFEKKNNNYKKLLQKIYKVAKKNLELYIVSSYVKST